VFPRFFDKHNTLFIPGVFLPAWWAGNGFVKKQGTVKQILAGALYQKDFQILASVAMEGNLCQRK
jgi:hypothetical protein